MKNCPHCGKSIPENADSCTYCGLDIPTLQPIPGATSIALTCPTCGGSLEYSGNSPTVRCKYCGNGIVVASQVLPPPAVNKNEAVVDQVRLLVELGESDQAVALLCQQLSIPLADAKGVVTLFEAGNYGSEAQIIGDVVRRSGSQAHS